MSSSDSTKVTTLSWNDDQKINELIKAKKYDKAIDACDIVLSLFPTHAKERMKGNRTPTLLYLQGVAYFSINNVLSLLTCDA